MSITTREEQDGVAHVLEKRKEDRSGVLVYPATNEIARQHEIERKRKEKEDRFTWEKCPEQDFSYRPQKKQTIAEISTRDKRKKRKRSERPKEKFRSWECWDTIQEEIKE